MKPHNSGGGKPPPPSAKYRAGNRIYRYGSTEHLYNPGGGSPRERTEEQIRLAEIRERIDQIHAARCLVDELSEVWE